MKIKTRRVIAILGLVLVLGLINWSIFSKQQLLQSGQTILLQLAPVDPRSLMQGDYMALNYSIGRDIYQALPKKDNAKHWRRDVDAGDGFVIVTVDANQVANFVRLDDGQALQEHERRLFYRVRNGVVKFASNAFFFEEGQAAIYQPARYGDFKLGNDGELLLTALRDEHYQVLRPLKPAE